MITLSHDMIPGDRYIVDVKAPSRVTILAESSYYFSAKMDGLDPLQSVLVDGTKGPYPIYGVVRAPFAIYTSPSSEETIRVSVVVLEEA